MFYPTTCVGLRYGPLCDVLSGFSREHGYHLCRLARGLAVLSRIGTGGGFACLPYTYPASTRYSVSARVCHFSVSASLAQGVTGS